MPVRSAASAQPLRQYSRLSDLPLGGELLLRKKRKMGVTDCLMARPVAQLCSMVLWLLIFLIAASAAAGPTRSVW